MLPKGCEGQGSEFQGKVGHLPKTKVDFCTQVNVGLGPAVAEFYKNSRGVMNYIFYVIQTLNIQEYSRVSWNEKTLPSHSFIF